MRIRWFKNADADLDKIEAYISEDNSVATIETVLRIINYVNQLVEYPSMGRPGRVEGTRELVIPGLPYTIPYRAKGETIQILRVLHHARKWPVKL